MSSDYTPIVVAIALSLYTFNVDPTTRATAIYEYFEGDCMELEDLITVLLEKPHLIATELPYPSAKIYVDQALKRYGEEAKKRAEGERLAFDYIKR